MGVELWDGDGVSWFHDYSRHPRGRRKWRDAGVQRTRGERAGDREEDDAVAGDKIATLHSSVAAGRYRQAEFAADLAQVLASCSEDARALAYRLFAICERKAWAEEALAAGRNGLVVRWPEIEKLAVRREEGEQGILL